MTTAGGRIWAVSRTLAAVLLLETMHVGPVAADEFYAPSVNDFGGVGLLQTRTARFAADGQLEVGASDIVPYRRYYITLQAVPWLEATFRYTDFELVPLVSDTYKDRGADLKFQILEERQWLPALAVGLQDGVGTGLFQSEYLVASKRFLDLDFSAGIAWGAMGTRGNIKNPLAVVGSFEKRELSTGLGGQFSLGNYFSGERAALFGGIEYFTPVRGLTLKIEYEGNDYSNEPIDELGNIVRAATSPFNFGVTYRLLDWFEVAVARERGGVEMVRFGVRTNLHAGGMTKFDEPPITLTPRSADGQDNLREGGAKPTSASAQETAGQDAGDDVIRTIERISDALHKAGLATDSIDFADSVATIQLSQPTGAPSAATLEAAAREVARTAADSLHAVAFLGLAADGGHDSATFTVSELNEHEIVEYLFDSLERGGGGVTAIDVTHHEATVTLENIVANPDRLRMASALLEALPMPVKHVTFVEGDSYAAERRVTLSRREVLRRSAIDDMFDRLEIEGFEVESIDFAQRVAVVTVWVEGHHAPVDYRDAGWTIANSMSALVDEVTVVGVRGGHEEARVTVLPHRSYVTYAGAEQESTTSGPSSPAAIDVAESMFQTLADQGVTVDAVHFTRTRATVFVQPGRYRQTARTVGRSARVIAANAPTSIEEISVVILASGVPINQVTVLRQDLENAVTHQGSSEEIWANATLESGPPYVSDEAVRDPKRYPSFNWSLTPQIRQFFGDASQFLLYQVYAKLSANLDVGRGVSINSVLSADIYNNFDKLISVSNSELPRVRSDIDRYLREGNDKVFKLEGNYVLALDEDLFARVAIGYFEEMFGGVGGELLYRPFGSRWAVGLDAHRVRQRDFEGRFGFLDYEVTTGHVNVYYDTPIYGMMAAMHIGQFLAGDRGTSYYLSRRFESGIVVGIWATLTNVTADRFGEGSFDKGLFISIPFDLFLLESSRKRGSFAFRPLSRDGGQMLGGSKRLYSRTQGGNLGEVARDWDLLLQ